MDNQWTRATEGLKKRAHMGSGNIPFAPGLMSGNQSMGGQQAMTPPTPVQLPEGMPTQGGPSGAQPTMPGQQVMPSQAETLNYLMEIFRRQRGQQGVLTTTGPVNRWQGMNGAIR